MSVVFGIRPSLDLNRPMPPIAHVNIASSEFKADPFPFYAQLRSEAPVYRAMLPDKRNAWLVTR